MNRRPIVQRAKEYMDLLAKGMDPICGEKADADSVASNPRLQKCFAFVSGILEELLDNDGFVELYPGVEGAPQYERIRKKVPFRLSGEQQRRVFIDREPVTARTFISRINRVIDGEAMERLSIKSIHAWLLKNGYISESKQPAVIRRTVLKPLPKAAGIGILEQETLDPETGELSTRMVLSPEGQRFLLDHLEQMLETPPASE